jgi:hypothetical protein
MIGSFVPLCKHSFRKSSRWTQEKVAKLYRKFRGPLMLKYLKELAANDQAMAVCNGHFSIFFLVEGC